MSRISWKKALALSLALSLSLEHQLLNRPVDAATSGVEPQAGGRGNRGGAGGQKGGQSRGGGGGGAQQGGPPRGGSGRPQGAQRAPGVQRAPGLQRAPGIQSNPGRGSVHVPPSSVTRQAPRQTGSPSGGIRTPAPSRPRAQTPVPQRGVANQSPVRGPGNVNNSNVRSGTPRTIGNRPPMNASQRQPGINRNLTGNNPRQPGLDRNQPGSIRPRQPGSNQTGRNQPSNINQARGDNTGIGRNNQGLPGNRNQNLPNMNTPLNSRDLRRIGDARNNNNVSGSNQRSRTDVNTNTNINNNINLNQTTRQFNNNTSSNYSRFNNRQYDGNQVRFRDRQWNVGSNNYRPSYSRHNRYHGFWNGLGNNWGYGGRGNNWGYGSGWGLGLGFNNFGYGNRFNGGYRPLGWGLGGWGLGSVLYNSGYLRYSNPYWVDSGTTIYNYSQPVPVVYTTTASTEVSSNNVDTVSTTDADQFLNDAVAEFQGSNYDAALDIVNRGILQYPDDAVLHEFRSLVLFARQDYQQSAATIHSVLAVGPGWNWTTLASMYSDVGLYTQQLRNLEGFTRSNPQDAASRFLLSYHYMTCGHQDAAIRQLEQVVQIKPDDAVAADLLRMLAPPTPNEPSSGTAGIAGSGEGQVASEMPTIDPSMLTGGWKATREDGSTFNLTLTEDAKFVWSFAAANQPPQEFGGTYSLEGNIIALERESGGALIAEVTPDGNGRFNFRIVGSPENDKGLQFIR